MNVSLTPELEQLVEETVSTGRYSSASEVIRASLRSFLDEERWKAYARAKIEKGLEDAAAGRIVDGEVAMNRIRKAVRAKR
jgi:antitoxin ParD1/3/4